ncbi:unnamed protein product, partial [Allacma fusca]
TRFLRDAATAPAQPADGLDLKSEGKLFFSVYSAVRNFRLNWTISDVRPLKLTDILLRDVKAGRWLGSAVLLKFTDATWIAGQRLKIAPRS